MTSSLRNPIGCYAGSALQLATWLSLLSALSPAAAASGTAYTGTGHLVAVPVPGVLCTNAAGFVSLKGNVHVMRVETTDPRTTGRLQASMDMDFLADGTATFGGSAVQEVGTWDLADPLNPRFMPSGGLWVLQYRGLAQADNSSQLTLTGYGIGGQIEGQEVTQTVARGPGVVLDPAAPYSGSGVVSTPPADTRVVLDNFDSPPAPHWEQGASSGIVTVMEAGGGLTIRGSWPSIRTRSGSDTTAWASPSRSWTARSGKTFEARVDLMGLTGPGAGAVLALSGFWVVKGPNYLLTGKQSGDQLIFLSAEPLVTPSSNVVLTLGITPSGPNILYTARVLDRNAAGTVRTEHTVVDTPNSDPSLTAAEIEAVTGMTFQSLETDPKGQSWSLGGSPWLGVFQYTDGNLPPAEATFDNFETCEYAAPQVAVERAVRLTWPAPTHGILGIESAPTIQGPWRLLQDPTVPGLGQLTLPATGDMQYFRTRGMP